MNRILWILLAIGVGVAGFSTFRRSADQTRAATAVNEQAWQTSTTRVTETQTAVASWRAELLDKQQRLRQATRHWELSPELLQLLEGEAFKGSPAAWAELRQQLGLGWDSCPDYVLVSKRVLKDLDTPFLLSGAGYTDTACALLALSPEEQAPFKALLQQARDGQWLRVQRTEPSGDIVAQYTVLPPEPALAQSVSNQFAAELFATLGPERADVLLPSAWREFQAGLAPAEPETLTLRRTVVEGEPDLVWEMKRGNDISTNPVQYAHYPASWFLTLFPGGWKTLAEREGFELPARFQK